MEARLLQPSNAEIPIEVTLLGIIVAEQPALRQLLLVSIMALQLSRESYVVLPSSTMMEVRLLQPEKAEPPMLATLSGMVMEVRLLQPENAQIPMLVTPSGIVMDARLPQPLNA